jgi:hypothetical protein
MSQVGIASCTEYFRSLHAKAVVIFQSDIQIRNRLVVTWPARSGVKFDESSKQVRPAPYALIYTRFLDSIEYAGKRAFCPLFAGDMILLRSQYRFPLSIRFMNLINVYYFVLTAVEYAYSFHNFRYALTIPPFYISLKNIMTLIYQHTLDAVHFRDFSDFVV